MPVIAHNIASQFTNRQLNITTGKKTKSAEKLSSGYKINRSADDAAGLQISEKMRSQIRGLNQASRNIQDGISLCQVADGALNETHDILQRMRELSVQAANDTNSEEDRNAIQSEIDELTKEVDRIANDTSFNEDIYPLKGNIINSTTSNTEMIITDLNGTKWKLPSNLTNTRISGIVNNSSHSSLVIDGTTYNDGDRVSVNAIAYTFSDGIVSYYGNTGIISYTEQLDWLTNTGSIYSTQLSDIQVDSDGFLYIQDSTNPNVSRYLGAYEGGNSHIITMYPTTSSSYLSYRLQATKISDNNGVNLPTSPDNNSTRYDLWIQMGAQAGQGMFLELVDATAKGVGITDPTLDVTSYDNANTSISRLDNAINRVSGYRSHFGAYQNRLECAKAVDDNTAENTQYAESRIRDTDMAEEMVEHSKNNILEQVGQSMLAQANQSTQGILSLLG